MTASIQACRSPAGLVIRAEVVGVGEDPAGQAAYRWVGLGLFGAALVEVAVEQVRAAGVAHRADLFQQGGRGHWADGAAVAQVVTVAVDQAGAVLRRPDELVGIGHPGVALDGVHRQPELAGALAQAGAGVEAFVNGVVAGEDLLVARAWGRLARLGPPAAGVRGDGLFDRLAQPVPQTPAITEQFRATG